MISIKDIFEPGVTKVVNTAVRIGTEHPMFAIGYGLAMLAVGDIMLVKTTMESSTDIDEVSETVEKVKSVEDLPSATKAKAVTFAYIRFVGKVGKRALPVLFTKALGVGCIVLAARRLEINAITAGATASMLEAHTQNLYKRIEEKYGKEAADDLRFNVKEHEVEEEVTDDKGKTKVIKRVVKKGDPHTYEPLLERYYDQSNPTFDRGLNGYLTNRDRWKNIQIWAQKKYDAGYVVTWNEVFGSGGFQRIIPGYNWGWDKSKPGAPAVIDFGINLDPQTTEEAMIWGDCVLLRPNCFKLYDVDDSEECFKTNIYGGRAIDSL